MCFSLNLGAWRTVFAVPAELVDRHLKLAGKEQLQVILWLLRHGGEAASLAEIAEGTGMPEENAEDALQYWLDNALLSRTAEGILAPAAPASQAQTKKPAPTDVPMVQQANPASPRDNGLQARRMLRPDSIHIATRINESPSIRCLMQETEAVLGKTISPALSADLISIHDDYGLPVEVIMMIIHYAKQVGKTSTSYIHSVAKDWAGQEIFTVDAADRKLQELDEKKLAWKKVEAACGIYHRAATKKEEAYAYCWVKEWASPPELITEAYERCADQTGKLSFAYMNKILEKWDKSGIKTMEQLREAESRIKDNKLQEKQKSYDVNELDEMSFFNPLEE